MCLYLKENHALVSGIICEAEDWGIKVCVPSFDFKGVVNLLYRPLDSERFKD